MNTTTQISSGEQRYQVTNARRAKRMIAVLAEDIDDIDTESACGRQNGITDGIANLLHYALLAGFDPYDLLHDANERYKGEEASAYVERLRNGFRPHQWYDATEGT